MRCGGSVPNKPITILGLHIAGLKIPPNFRPDFQGRTRHISLKKSSGHRPGVPGTPGGTNRGLPAVIPGISACYGKTGIFAGTPAGCARDTRPPREFSEILCDFFLCAFSAPQISLNKDQEKFTDELLYARRENLFGGLSRKGLSLLQKVSRVGHSVFARGLYQAIRLSGTQFDKITTRFMNVGELGALPLCILIWHLVA